MEISKDEMYNHQLMNFNTYLKQISDGYAYLSGQRIYLDDMPRDEYMVYDMMDMLIHLTAVLNEVKSKNIYPDYMVEKLSKMISYVDTTLSYFESRNKND